MKKIYIYLYLLVIIALTSGCLDTDSDLLAYPDETQLDSPSDSLYSIVGILNRVEKLADSYVLLGELRGDLMDISTDANADLKEIYNHEISENNAYNNVRDYYSVINYCNYVIQNIDTTITVRSKKVNYKTYAAAKAFRAWTYLQLGLNYGNVKYYQDPILKVKDSSNYVVYSLQELIPVLIQELLPWQDIETPVGFSLGSDLTSSRDCFFPIRLLLGDLYLWHGDYENAAIVYHDLIYQNNLIVYAYRSTWTVTNGVFVSRESKYTLWPGMVFNMNNYNEQITMLASSTENGRGAELDSLSWYKNELIPSAIAINNWNSQFYFYNKDSYRKGDLRGDMGSYISPANGSFFDDKNMKVSSSENVITKFHLMTKETVKAVSINRVALLYLHYAEALNRIKKPNMAFAILKDGLGPYTMSIDTITPPNEKYSNITNQTIYSYLNFDNAEFDNSIAIHGRGCGNIWYATDKYNIPTLSNINDSMDWVEDKIIEECALETAFEGNRFHDLMRIAFRRTDPSYLANKVAEKYGSDKEAIRTKLLDVNNWYIH